MSEIPKMRFKEATAGLFVALCMGAALKLVPGGGVEMTAFVSGAILFTICFALRMLVDNSPTQSTHPGRDKLWLILLSPVVGTVLSGALVAVFKFWPLFLGLALLALLGLIISFSVQYARYKRQQANR